MVGKTLLALVAVVCAGAVRSVEADLI